MIVTITSNSTIKEIESAIRKLEKGLKVARKPKKDFDALKYCGVIKLKEDPIDIQKKMRDEWE
jgi:preprotein translocase subunit Sss1